MGVRRHSFGGWRPLLDGVRVTPRASGDGRRSERMESGVLRPLCSLRLPRLSESSLRHLPTTPAPSHRGAAGVCERLPKV